MAPRSWRKAVLGCKTGKRLLKKNGIDLKGAEKGFAMTCFLK